MRKRADRPFVFVGPTLGARRLPRTLRALPPVARGDVAKLAERERPGTIVIVDGVFHETLAVGHAEIRDAVRAGWRVWGLSSMGAIRAREMRDLGVRGYGRVYERFCEDGDFQDDEVALLHEQAPPYRAVTEPLVHLRAAVAWLVRARVVEEGAADAAIADLKSRWYGERTIRLATELLAKHAPREPREPREPVRRELASFDRFRLKTIDLERFVEERAWCPDGRIRPR